MTMTKRTTALCTTTATDPYDSRHHCDPWCECWGGDGLCMLEIERQVEEAEEFEMLYVAKAFCPVCGLALTEYSIPTDKLWAWPGDFYNPMIALEIFAVYDAPKGEFHRHGNLAHIWVGED